MVRSLIRTVRRGIASRLYAPKIRDRENTLSESGIFDFALSNPTKREVIESTGTSSIGTRRRYDDDDFRTLNSMAYDAPYRSDYMVDYIDDTDDDFIRQMKAVERYIQSQTIPKLVECKVLEAVVEKEDGSRVYVYEVDELLDMNVLEAYKSQYKQSGIFVLNPVFNNEIIGARPGVRFDFAYTALKNTHLQFEDSHFAESRI